MNRVSAFSFKLLGVLCGLAATTLLPAQNAFVRSLPLSPFSGDIQPVPATGGYLLASLFYDGPTSTMILMELDAFCRTQAIHGVTSSEELEFIGLVPLAGGNFGGYGLAYNGDGYGFTALVDAQGNVSQPRMLGFTPYDYFFGGVALPDSGFAVVGLGEASFQNEWALAARLNAQGDTVWTRAYAIMGEDLELNAVDVLPGGDLIAVGTHGYGAQDDSGLLLWRVSPNGQLVWAKSYATSRNLFAHDIRVSGNKVFVAFSTEDPISFDANMGIAAFDAAGGVSWAQELGGFQEAGGSALHLSAAGEPLLLGYYESSAGFDASMAALDANGNLLWARGYGLNGDAYPLSVLAQPGGTHLMLAVESTSTSPLRLIQTLQDGLIPGPCNSLNPAFLPTSLSLTVSNLSPFVFSGSDLLVPVLGSSSPAIANTLACDAVAIEAASAQAVAQVVPQPMGESSRIVLSLDAAREGLALQVTDLAGRAVDMKVQATSDGFLLHRNGLPAGLYAYQVLHDGLRVAAGKVWVAD
jgi:hypothetical protein